MFLSNEWMDWNPKTIIIPVYGQVSAGKPVEALPIMAWRKIRIPTGYKQNDKYFALIVNGHSLRDNAIMSGDLAICRVAYSVPNGKLAVVVLNGGVTLKYVFGDAGGTIWLEGAHPDYPATPYEADAVQVQGQVIRIERDL